ncbi:hypothetical protein [Halpernia sp. GG3]
MKFLLQIFLFFIPISLYAQQERSADYYAQIPEKIENEREIRIYKDFAISDVKKIFRIYLNKDSCNAELISIRMPSQSGKNIEVKPEITKLKCSNETFLNFEVRNIQFLPKEEFFNYKKVKKTISYNEENKQNEIISEEMKVMDGSGYYIRYKNGDNFNSFFYSNPETYIKQYPEINELKSFVEILDFINDRFKIKF